MIIASDWLLEELGILLVLQMISRKVNAHKITLQWFCGRAINDMFFKRLSCCLKQNEDHKNRYFLAQILMLLLVVWFVSIRLFKKPSNDKSF